ncbi:putative F-box protein At3g25750 [Prunus avium]|uniref:F-box protein At3g25750 n=1 Tax=Prunus avium TaxID=42229 RepID=A0A6P5RHD7_PRUAV|nr:putative F-box protein At3g25750 [Prunus avium]
MAEAISSTFDSGWAWLPSHVLDLILDKLIPISDYIRFGVVCKRWRSVALYQKQQRLQSCHKQLPMLIIPRNRGGRGSLYGVTQGKAYSFELPQHGPKYNNHSSYGCCSSCHGWLAYMGGEFLVLTLFNPFTGGTILLPPVKEVPDIHEDMDFFLGSIFYKVALSADPSLFPNGFEALIVYHTSDSPVSQVAHYKAGDVTWTRIDARMILSDAIYYKGQFLAVTSSGGLLSVNVNSDPATTTWCIRSTRGSPSHTITHNFLVESSREDLLLVEKSYSRSWDLAYKVWSAYGDDGGAQWVEIESIGTDALFLDWNVSMSVSALDFPECRPNSIYFIDYVDEFPQVGVFNLENGNVEKDCVLQDPSEKCLLLEPKRTGLWILPTIV